jgi:hypothetical protein
MNRRVFNKFAMLAVASVGFLAGCGDDTEPTPGGPDDPAMEVIPADNGTVEISFTNIPGTDPSVSAAAGQEVSVSVRIKKTPNGSRPQKLRVWDATKEGTRGTQYESTIDLRNIDDQTKTVDYVVPSTSGTRYLYFEVDESGSKFQRKLLKVNVGGSATVASWTDRILGAQNNAAGSRIASATGDVYTVCDIQENINYIDITYASLGSTSATATLLSNPQRATEGLRTSTTNKPCQDPANPTGATIDVQTGGGRNTYFAPVTGVNFDTADEAALKGLTIPTSGTSASQKIVVKASDVVAFQNSDGKKGLIRVKNLAAGVDGTITLDIKVQR